MTNYELQIKRNLKWHASSGRSNAKKFDVDNLEVAAYFHPARFIGGDFIKF